MSNKGNNVMKLRHLLAGTAGAAALLVGGSAFASAIFGNASGTINIKFANYESFGNLSSSGNLQVGSTNYGVFEVTSVDSTSGTPIWSSGQNGQYLVGIFNGITVTSITPSSTGFVTGNSGGTFELYEVSSLPNFSAGTGGYCGSGVGSLCYNGISNTGTPVLTFNLVPGADSLNPSDTFQATVAGTTVPVSGSSLSYADVTGGSEASEFTTGGFTTAIGTAADLFLQDDFKANNGAVGNWADLSQDPVEADVPEPASLALFGAGLLFLGWFVNRRKKHVGQAEA